jgi:hypothetical protein
MIFFGVRSLERAIKNFIAHYHSERNHQGIGNNLINPEPGLVCGNGKVHCRERLGGLLRYYYRTTA